MTCIVGIVENGEVIIGGDSAGVAGYSLTIRADRKVFRNGPFVMGFTSSFRMGQLLAHSLKPPKRHPDEDVYAWMVTDFVNAVRDCLKSGGFAEKHNEAEIGGTFLVGYDGRLFVIDSDYQVGETVDGFAAVGCGHELAVGSLYSTSVPPTSRSGDQGARSCRALQRWRVRTIPCRDDGEGGMTRVFRSTRPDLCVGDRASRDPRFPRMEIAIVGGVALVLSGCASSTTVRPDTPLRDRIPPSLLQCADRPQAGSLDRQSDVARFVVELDQAGEDCRRKVRAVGQIVEAEGEKR